MKINPTFPPSRLQDPMRRAERDIYQAIAASPIPGRALYEVKVTGTHPRWTCRAGSTASSRPSRKPIV